MPGVALCVVLTIWMHVVLACTSKSEVGLPKEGSVSQETHPWDPERLSKVQLALRVSRLAPGQADKYAWVRVRVLSTLKNTSGQTIGPELDVAYYAGDAGVPAGECTVYLEPYNQTPGHPWKLLGGGARLGVSHVQAPSTPAPPKDH